MSDIDVEPLVDDVDNAPEVYARIAELEVSVVGHSDSSLGEVAQVFEREFERTVETYVNYRESGEFR